jgi:hypothetical protein
MSDLISRLTTIRHPGVDVPGWDCELSPQVVEAHVAQVERMRGRKPLEIKVEVMHGDEVLDVLARPDLRDAMMRIGAKVTFKVEF